MKSWKERGVVPDSEDESGSDSGRNSLASPLSTNAFPSTTIESTTTNTQPETDLPSRTPEDIWDIPDSSQPNPVSDRLRSPEDISSTTEGKQAEAVSSSPLSWLAATPSPSASPNRARIRQGKQPETAESWSQRSGLSIYDFPTTDPESASVSDVEDEHADTTITHDAVGTRSLVLSVNDMLSSQSMPDTVPDQDSNLILDQDSQMDDVISGLSGSRQPSVSQPLDTSNAESTIQASAPSSNSGTQEILQNNITMEAMLRMEAEAPRRTFRPRKPIQQHPYALEMAKYNQQLKARGMKPLRLVESTQEPRRRREEVDSQDQDFEEDSQEARIPGDDAMDNLVVGTEELNLLSSTSKPGRKRQPKPLLDVGSFTQAASAYDFPSASQESDDLPSLEDVFSKSTPRNGKRPSSPSTVRQKKRARVPIAQAESPDELSLPANQNPPVATLYIPSSSPPPINTSARRRLRPSQNPTKTSRLAPEATPSRAPTAASTSTTNTYNFFNDFDDDDNNDINATLHSTRTAPTLIISTSPGSGPLTSASSKTVANPETRDATPVRSRRLHRQDSIRADETLRTTGRQPDFNIFDSDDEDLDVSTVSRNPTGEDIESASGRGGGNDNGSGSDGDQRQEESKGSSSDIEEVDRTLKKFGRRLRGILPPSYLRITDQIEQQKQRAAAQAANTRRRASPKKGVAQTRIGIGHTHGSFLESLVSSDEEEEEGVSKSEEWQPEYVQRQLALEPVEDDEVFEVSGRQRMGQDRDSSDMEEDYIDINRMLSASRKRTPVTQNVSRKSGLKRQKTVSAGSKLGKVPRNQPLIMSHFSSSAPQPKSSSSTPRVKPSSSSRLPSSKSKSTTSRRFHRSSYVPQPRKPRVPPPELSILDTVEANAPRFVRVAARSSRHTAGNGRASPSRKVFQLANRWDNRDVNQVLHNWKAGRIKQRDLPPPKPRAQRKNDDVGSRVVGGGGSGSRGWTQMQTARPALTEIHGTQQTTSKIQPGMMKQVLNIDGTTTYAAAIPGPHDSTDSPQKRPSHHPGIYVSKPQAALRREFSPERASSRRLPPNYIPHIHRVATFQAAKRLLDDLYDRTKITVPLAPPTVASVLPPPGTSAAFARDDGDFDLDQPAVMPAVARQARRKLRKQYRPHRVDVQAPQFVRTADPLPPMILEDEDDEIAVRGNLVEEKQKTKLTGLGPFGTHYTVHFDVFPLMANVSFHGETLLGRGLVDKATEKHDQETMKVVKASASFCFGDFNFKWGAWDDDVASEFGVLVDAVCDNLASPSEETPLPDYVIIEAADFFVWHIQDAISFSDETAQLSFAARIMSVLREFHSRVDGMTIAVPRRNLVVKVLTRIMIGLFTAHHICKNSPALISEAMNLEMLMVDMSKVTFKFLLSYGLRSLQDFYAETQCETATKRAIGAEKVDLQAWVVLMRILEVSNIPRMSFWDVLYSVLIKPEDVVTGSSAARFEVLWETMFSLLPLCEFNSLGTMVHGIRKARSMDGWGLPQKVLRRVLDIYKEGGHQSASFNEYCRVLVARCHHLIDEWGWTKCNSIVGLIFDFFGSQNLSHLRNEEVFKSPRFLENLCSSPSLAIDAGDRCFHIFLKLTALAIQRLTAKNATNEIRNLIARIMPNHNRQFLKDQNIHHTDLACLRNHHDLLCTIFWVAPPDLRPNTQLIAKLVEPAESHKEACLVNLRAWNQLARFVAKTNDDPKVFRAFLSWQNNVFRQLLDQYKSVASDMQAQLRALPTGTAAGAGVNQAKIDMFVAINRAAIRDILLFSARASQDIMRYAKSREAAVFAVNTYQLNEILQQFTYSPPPLLDWPLLLTVLGTLRMFLERDVPQEMKDAVRRSDALLLQREVADNLFGATRTVITERDKEAKQQSQKSQAERDASAELLVLLCGHATMVLSRIGAVKVSDVFSSGKWALFEGPRHRLPLRQRRFLGLYMATLMSQMPIEIEPTVMSGLELWLSIVVRPEMEGRGFEHMIAGEMLRRKKEFAGEEAVRLSVAMTYAKKEVLFEGILSWMRETLRSTSAASRKTTLAPFTASLRLAMDQIKYDLSILSPTPSLHTPFVLFVRNLISLIRSHATDICAVDSFFYQISRDYSPPQTDPKLHVAGMTSYGLRLNDGDARVIPQLFHYLYNNFKIALVNDKVATEIKMVARGMRNSQIWTFIVTRMVPAAFRTAMVLPQAYFFFDVYAGALVRYTSKPEIPDDLSISDLQNIGILLDHFVSALYRLIRTRSADVSFYTVRSILRAAEVVRVLWPLVRVHSFNSDSRTVLSPVLTEAGRIARVTRVMIGVLEDWRGRGFVDVSVLEAGIDLERREQKSRDVDVNVLSFAGIVEGDVKRAWEVRNGRLFIRGAGTVGGVGPKGFPLPLLRLEEVLGEVETELGRWCVEWEGVDISKMKVQKQPESWLQEYLDEVESR